MSRQPTIWLDGARTDSLSLPDRGLDFGDGLFETILVYKGTPLFSEYHLDRLALGLKVLGLRNCLESVESQLQHAARATIRDTQWAVLRLSVIRASGPRGYTPAIDSTPRILMYATILDRDCAKMDRCAALCIARIRLSAQPALARIKHLNRLDQIMAAVQTQEEGADEAIMLDQVGHLTSVIAGNIFLVSDGMLLTPFLHDCGVAGTRRRLIIEKWAPAIGLKVRETRLSLSDLECAEEVFYSNSIVTVRPIASLNDQRWENHSVCEALFQRYLEDLPS